MKVPLPDGRFLVGLFLAFLSVAGFASTFIVGGALSKRCGVDPLVLSFLRFTIAGLVMLGAGLVSRTGRARLLALRPRDRVKIAWLGPVGTVLMAWFVFLGCARVSVANASMADALTPFLIFIVAALVRRRIRFSEIAALAVGLAGALLVIQVVTPAGIALSAYSWGDVFIFLAAATWAVYTVLGAPVIARAGSMAFTCWTMLVGAALLGVVLPFVPCAWPADLVSWELVLLLGFVSTLLPFWTWNAAQRYLPMSVLAMSAYFTPVVAMALGMVFLGESATFCQWCGTAFVVLSAVLITKG